jgi:hypothetical protein
VNDGSFDPDNEPITFESSPQGPYPLGATPVTLTVRDGSGASASCTATVTVQDTTPPQILVVLHPDTLWPPNHRMVDVDASVVAADNCGAPTVELVSVTSSEADNGVDDGDTVNDVQGATPGTADFAFSLRAERAGSGVGRVYTATYRARDAANNTATDSGHAVVPHDRSGVTDPIAVVLQESAAGTTVSWSAAPGASSYNVIRGDVGSLRDAGPVIDLGAVQCIEAASLDPSTEGREDAARPASGEAFFYLVEYDDGTSCSYGAESADKPRAPGSGGCQ